MPTQSVQDIVRQEAQRAGVPPELALAVADQETGFDPTRRGSAGELGAMQLMPATAKIYGVDPSDPIQGIRGGVQHLKRLLDTYQGDLPKVLAAYNAGEGRVNRGAVPTSTQQTYVPSVLTKLKQYAAPPPVSPGATTPAPGGQVGQPPPTEQPGFISRTLSAFNPMTSEGRGNLAGMVGAGALTAVAPEIAIPGMALAVPAAGAYLGGATEQLGEMNWAGQPPPGGVAEAGRKQATQELIGQGLTRLVTWPIRGMASTSVGKQVTERLGSTLDTAHAAWDRLMGNAPKNAEVGRAVEAVAQGPAREHLKHIGQQVEESAKTGPPVDISAVKQSMHDMHARTLPSTMQAAEEPAGANLVKNAVRSGAADQNYLNALKAAGIDIEPSHPLPGVLKALDEAPDQISFEDAHKFKRIFDEAVNWDSPARKQVQQITKGARQQLRGAMSDVGHAPYEDATKAYQETRPLFESGIVKQLHKVASTEPEAIAKLVRGNEPTKLGMLKEVLTTQAAHGGAPADAVPVTRIVRPGDPLASDSATTWFHIGHLTDEEASKANDMYARGNGRVIRGYLPKESLAPALKRANTDELGHQIADVPTRDVQHFRAEKSGGEEAWNGVRAAWTHKNLIRPGIDRLDDSLAKMDPDFASQMFGDKDGAAVLDNLKTISQAAKDAKAYEARFNESSLAKTASAREQASAVGHMAASPSSPFAWRDMVRNFGRTAKSADLIQWASLSSRRTQMLVAALTKPELTGLPHLVASHGHVGQAPPTTMPAANQNAMVGAPPP